MSFGREVLPYGVFSVGDGPRRVGVAVDDGVLDLAEHLGPEFDTSSLNPFLSRGRAYWTQVRSAVRDLVGQPLEGRHLLGQEVHGDGDHWREGGDDVH